MEIINTAAWGLGVFLNIRTPLITTNKHRDSRVSINRYRIMPFDLFCQVGCVSRSTEISVCLEMTKTKATHRVARNERTLTSNKKLSSSLM